MLRTVDTDIVVLAVSHFGKLKLEDMWIAFGVKRLYHFILVHEISLPCHIWV